MMEKKIRLKTTQNVFQTLNCQLSIINCQLSLNLFPTISSMFKLLRENIRIATGSIRTQLLRTVLTVMIIAIGITALVCILTVLAALENTISGKFASMGANTFNVTQYNFSEQLDADGKDKPHSTTPFPPAMQFVSRFD